MSSKRNLGKYGDIVLLDFDPSAGKEIQKRRPAVIVSNDTYNEFCTTRMVCPITHTDRPFPLHVALNDKTKTQGVVKCEQVKALDVPIRHIQILESMPDELMEEISDILIGCVERNG